MAVLPTTPALDLLLLRAAWIGQGEGASPVASFTSVFLSFLASPDPVSLWIQDKVGWIGPTLADVVRRWNADRTLPRGLDEARVRKARTLSETDLAGKLAITTPSAVGVLAAARDLARRVSAEQTDVHHVLAAYLYAPHGHGDDLKAWKLDREAWATRFRCHVTAAHPSEADAWRKLHDEQFPRQPSIGVAEARMWATQVAARTSSSSIDSRALLAGILLDGLNYLDTEVASARLVQCLGGRATVEAVLDGARPSRDATRDQPLPFSEDALRILDRALVFATAAQAPLRPGGTGVATLHVRHLVSALLTDRQPLAAFELVRRARRTAEGVLAQFRTWLDSVTDGADHHGVRNRIFEELRDDVLAGYDNDEAHGEDRLNIEPEVRALAAVLASTQVTPPLSLGLFGDWGSGKSFFMAKLRERIDQLARAAKAKPGAESWFCGKQGEVVQIDFNAWHYMDADLWSSLAVRVFDVLSDRLKGEFASACLRRLESLQERDAELREARQQLATQERQLDTALEDQRRVRAQRALDLREYVEGVAGVVAREVAADPQVKAVTERLHVQGKEIQTELQHVKVDLGTLLGTLKRCWQTRSPARFAAIGLVLAVPVIAGIVSSAYLRAGWTATTSFAGLLAAIGAVAPFVRKTAKQVQDLLGGALDRIDRIEADARVNKTRKELETERERDELGTRISMLEREQLALSKRRTDLEAELATLRQGDKKSLQEFILQRAATSDYRKNLGVVSAVHRDFKQLAGFLAPSQEPPNVERIILYIDDLDRCSPERVVEVLQAIHVILSLPLFVVIVAVDSRWLLDSLTTYYRRQFPIEGATIDAARPQHYLEKIFQIPYTLMPMSSDGYRDLVGSLLQRHVDAPPEDGPITGLPEHPIHHGSGPSPGPAGTAGAPRARATPASSARVDLTPRGLRLEPTELAYVTTLSGLIASPRAAKRLVNLYRIVRTSLDDAALDQLIDHRYKITQICLAIVVGNPTLGAEIFEQILSRKLGSPDDLIRWCRRRSAASHKPSARDGATLREILAREAELADWAAVRDAVRRVARFSFETGRVLGLYALEAPAAPAHPAP